MLTFVITNSTILIRRAFYGAAFWCVCTPVRQKALYISHDSSENFACNISLQINEL